MSQLNVQVRDTGKGIDPEDFSHLFKRYGKLNRTAQLNKEGLGLGLTIVQEIVEAGNGRITVESDGINRGACFNFSMQMAEAPSRGEHFNFDQSDDIRLIDSAGQKDANSLVSEEPSELLISLQEFTCKEQAAPEEEEKIEEECRFDILMAKSIESDLTFRPSKLDTIP